MRRPGSEARQRETAQPLIQDAVFGGSVVFLLEDAPVGEFFLTRGFIVGNVLQPAAEPQGGKQAWKHSGAHRNEFPSDGCTKRRHNRQADQ